MPTRSYRSHRVRSGFAFRASTHRYRDWRRAWGPRIYIRPVDRARGLQVSEWRRDVSANSAHPDSPWLQRRRCHNVVTRVRIRESTGNGLDGRSSACFESGCSEQRNTSPVQLGGQVVAGWNTCQLDLAECAATTDDAMVVTLACEDFLYCYRVVYRRDDGRAVRLPRLRRLRWIKELSRFKVPRPRRAPGAQADRSVGVGGATARVPGRGSSQRQRQGPRHRAPEALVGWLGFEGHVEVGRGDAMTATVLHLLNSAGVSLLVNDERPKRCWSDQLLRHRDVRNHRPCKDSMRIADMVSAAAAEDSPLPRTLSCAMLCSKLTANMSHKRWNDWVSPISATSRCARGCPSHPHRESTECALKAWPSAVGGRHR